MKKNKKLQKTKRKSVIKNNYSKKLKRRKKILVIKFSPFNFLKIPIIFLLLFLLIAFNLDIYKLKQRFGIINKSYEKYEKYSNINSTCDSFDPLYIFNDRLKNGRKEICNENNTKHICYIENNGIFDKVFKDGVICTMENIVLDPSKFAKTNLIYNGPVDPKNHGFPFLSKGFLNTKCTPNKIRFKYNKDYKAYFESWDYDYNMENESELLEELAPGKTVLLIGRNEGSPNLYHGNCEIINFICMLYLFNLSPEEVQVVIFEGIKIPEDPFYGIYKNIFSIGSEPIYVKNLTKKYKISKAINVPINLDSPLFTFRNIPKCNSTTKTFQIYNDFVDKYLDLKPFKDKFITDNITYYYPIFTIKNHENGIIFKKIVTLQWRKVYPHGRKYQPRILGNAINLTNKLAQALPNDILVRLIDTATLPYKEQISLMRNTDYLIGIHGAGLSLSIFLPKKSIMYEIRNSFKNNLPAFMSTLSGHITHTDIIKS